MTRLSSALPFWISLVLLPLAAIGAQFGGWTVFLLPLYGWVGISLLDAAVGQNHENPDPQTPEGDLFWYRLITLAWFPIHARPTNTPAAILN